MKILAAACFIAIAVLFSGAADAKSKGSRTTTVKGHVTKKGTYVPRHVRTSPNATKRDNYSTKGNVNPYTGKQGTKNPNR